LAFHDFYDFARGLGRVFEIDAKFVECSNCPLFIVVQKAQQEGVWMFG
jgi:hypothetical protein